MDHYVVDILMTSVAAIGLYVLNRSMRWTVREKGGKGAALRLVAACNVAALILGALGLLTRSVLPLVLAAFLVAFADLFPRPIIALTGGPRPLFLFRQRFVELWTLLERRPLTAEDITTAKRLRVGVEELRSKDTGRALDAIGAVFAAQFPTDVDHDATLRAYDDVNVAIAELGDIYRAEKADASRLRPTDPGTSTHDIARR